MNVVWQSLLWNFVHIHMMLHIHMHGIINLTKIILFTGLGLIFSPGLGFPGLGSFFPRTWFLPGLGSFFSQDLVFARSWFALSSRTWFPRSWFNPFSPGVGFRGLGPCFSETFSITQFSSIKPIPTPGFWFLVDIHWSCISCFSRLYCNCLLGTSHQSPDLDS